MLGNSCRVYGYQLVNASACTVGDCAFRTRWRSALRALNAVAGDRRGRFLPVRCRGRSRVCRRLSGPPGRRPADRAKPPRSFADDRRASVSPLTLPTRPPRARRRRQASGGRRDLRGAVPQQRHAQASMPSPPLLPSDLRLGSPEAISNLLSSTGGPRTDHAHARRRARAVRPGRSARARPQPLSARDRHGRRSRIGAAPIPKTPLRSSAPRTVVRRARAANLRRDLGRLAAYPVLTRSIRGLKMGLERHLARAGFQRPLRRPLRRRLRRPDGPVSPAAARSGRRRPESDPEFAVFLRNRAAICCPTTTKSGDAAWVTGRFKTLYAAIGALRDLRR